MYAFIFLFRPFLFSHIFQRALYIWILFIVVSYFVYSLFFLWYSLYFFCFKAHTKNVHRFGFIICLWNHRMHLQRVYVVGCLPPRSLRLYLYTNQQLKIKVKETRTECREKNKKSHKRRRTHSHKFIQCCHGIYNANTLHLKPFLCRYMTDVCPFERVARRCVCVRTNVYKNICCFYSFNIFFIVCCLQSTKLNNKKVYIDNRWSLYGWMQLFNCFCVWGNAFFLYIVAFALRWMNACSSNVFSASSLKNKPTHKPVVLLLLLLHLHICNHALWLPRCVCPKNAIEVYIFLCLSLKWRQRCVWLLFQVFSSWSIHSRLNLDVFSFFWKPYVCCKGCSYFIPFESNLFFEFWDRNLCSRFSYSFIISNGVSHHFWQQIRFVFVSIPFDCADCIDHTAYV